MASELSWRHVNTGSTVYVTIRSAARTYWNGSALEALTVANWANYDIALTETPASSYFYVGTWPAALTTAGWYWADVYEQAGAAPAISDLLVGTIVGHWNGTTFLPWATDTRQWEGVAVGGMPESAHYHNGRRTWYCNSAKANDDGDGTTPDTAKKTLVAAKALMSDGDILLVFGAHTETATLDFSAMSRVEVRGDGLPSISGDLSSFNPVIQLGNSNRLVGLKLCGTGVAAGSIGVVKATGKTDVQIDDCVIESTDVGVIFAGSCTGARVRRCDIRAAEAAIEITGGTGRILDCELEGKEWLLCNTWGVAFYPASVHDHWVVRDCEINVDTQTLVEGYGSVGVLVDSGYNAYSQARLDVIDTNIHVYSISTAIGVQMSSAINAQITGGSIRSWSNGSYGTDIQGIGTVRAQGCDYITASGVIRRGHSEETVVRTTVATKTSQTIFTLTAGSETNDYYLGRFVDLHPALVSSSNRGCRRRVTGYVGATKTVTIDRAPDFTLGVADEVWIFYDTPEDSTNDLTHKTVWTDARAAKIDTTNTAAVAVDTLSKADGAGDLAATKTAAVSAAASGTTALARLGAWAGTGVNTVLGALRALFRKTGAAAPSDIGGTYDPATDSAEALGEKTTTFPGNAALQPAGMAGLVHVDIRGTVFKEDTLPLMARVYGADGELLTQASITAVAYSIFVLDEKHPDVRAAVDGHTAVSLAVADVLYDTLQTDPLWRADSTGYNFKHWPDRDLGEPFAEAETYCLVEYRLTPAAGEAEEIVVRFRVHAI